jgi:uncharacterized membrane protein
LTEKTIVFSLMTFLHDLFTVIWMGGLIVAAISFMPAVKEALGPGPQVKKVMAAFQKRQSAWVFISMVGLILTGLVMTHRSADFEHLFGWGNPYSVALSLKHILVIGMIAATLYRALVLGRAGAGMTPEQERLNRALLMTNVALAVTVLLLSGLVAALGTPLHGGTLVE